MPKKTSDDAAPKKAAASDAAAPAPKADAEKAPKGNGKKLLIIEDEKPLAHALELKMKHEGYAVETALNGMDGQKLAEAGKYDMILLDLIMPEIDGFTLLKAIRDKGVKTPVIILSNLGQDEDRAKAQTLGVTEYFVKANTPISEIIAKVKSVL